MKVLLAFVSIFLLEATVFAQFDTFEKTGPHPPEIAREPLEPLSTMQSGTPRAPGFAPPSTFQMPQNNDVNLGFVVKRGRAKVMGFSHRKSENVK
ncbi:unnamed protein product [Caenorhabditis auriculariae]|uniref:Uncharacterized protein n=1 Tax=Caenorhabditis auriculariae TaxID=2777116 RepID=A0A8S1HJR7_9PELO|nr:unnamed protein product [Caenorhabditis auriculariae]